MPLFDRRPSITPVVRCDITTSAVHQVPSLITAVWKSPMSRFKDGALLMAAVTALLRAIPADGQEAGTRQGEVASTHDDVETVFAVQDMGAGRFLDWSYRDASDWLTSWNTGRLAKVGIAAAILVPLSFADEPVTRSARDTGTGGVGWILDKANELGGPGAVVIPAGVFGLSLLGGDRKFQDAAFTSLQSYLYSNALVVMLKTTAGRMRPEYRTDAHDFRPFSGATSFPSGHTSSAVSIVMPWVFYYPGIPTIALAAVATGTAAARVERGKHWVTDVVASMVIATSMSWYLSRRHQGRTHAVGRAGLGVLEPARRAVAGSDPRAVKRTPAGELADGPAISTILRHLICPVAVSCALSRTR